jgi:hypothetical protein
MSGKITLAALKRSWMPIVIFAWRHRDGCFEQGSALLSGDDADHLHAVPRQTSRAFIPSGKEDDTGWMAMPRRFQIWLAMRAGVAIQRHAGVDNHMAPTRARLLAAMMASPEHQRTTGI